MSKAVEKYFDKITKAATPKLLRLFKNKDDAKSIRQYEWCEKLDYKFEINDTKLDLETTDNPGTFIITAKKLTNTPENEQELTKNEIAAHATNVTNTLRKALQQNQKTLEDLQKKGFLFKHEKLDVCHVGWKSHQASWGIIEITFFTYDK